MKKTLIALAALTVTGAFAQSAVTIYGRAHVAYDFNYQSTGSVLGAAGDLKNRRRVSDDSSRIGFRITEDLGGGLTAGFNLEGGLNVGNGSTDNGGPAGSIFDRAANVSLSGGFGSITGGLQLSPFILSYVTTLGLAGNNFLVPTLVNAGAADTGGAGTGATGGFFIPTSGGNRVKVV